jgi:hypothetical protein
MLCDSTRTECARGPAESAELPWAGRVRARERLGRIQCNRGSWRRRRSRPRSSVGVPDCEQQANGVTTSHEAEPANGAPIGRVVTGCSRCRTMHGAAGETAPDRIPRCGRLDVPPSLHAASRRTLRGKAGPHRDDARSVAPSLRRLPAGDRRPAVTFLSRAGLADRDRNRNDVTHWMRCGVAPRSAGSTIAIRRAGPRAGDSARRGLPSSSPSRKRVSSMHTMMRPSPACAATSLRAT